MVWARAEEATHRASAKFCPWGFSVAEGVDRRRAGKKLFVRIFLLWLSRRIWRWTEPIGGLVFVPRIPSLMIVVSRGVYFTFYIFRISPFIAFALYSRIMLSWFLSRAFTGTPGSLGNTLSTSSGYGCVHPGPPDPASAGYTGSLLLLLMCSLWN